MCRPAPAPPPPTVFGRRPLDGCVDDADAACLLDNSFSVKASYTAGNRSGTGTAVPLTAQSASFWFFSENNRELLVKVLDGCGLNGHYWFFAGGLTDVGVQLELRDHRGGTVRLYDRPEGEAFSPLLDTRAIECDGRAAATSARRSEQPVQSLRLPSLDPASSSDQAPDENVAIQRQSQDGCGGDPNDMCLNGGRFRVEIDWTRPNGEQGPGVGGELASSTGVSWFFEPANYEMMVKVLDGCGVNGHYWFYAAGITDVGVSLRVTDTETGVVKNYGNPVGRQFQPITDTSAFATCP